MNRLLTGEPLQPYPVKGQVIQRLKAFDNPEGSIFSADGQFVFTRVPWRFQLKHQKKWLEWFFNSATLSRGEKKETPNQPHPNSVFCDSFAI